MARADSLRLHDLACTACSTSWGLTHGLLPGIDGTGVPRVLASFMFALLPGAAARALVDGGRQRRSFIAVEEFVDGVVRIVARPSVSNGRIFNLGNARNDVSIRALGEALVSTYRARVPGARFGGFRDVSAEAFYGHGYDDTSERIPDPTKAEQLLDFRPSVTLAEMLPGIVDDYVRRYAPRLALDGAKAMGSRRPGKRRSSRDPRRRSFRRTTPSATSARGARSHRARRTGRSVLDRLGRRRQHGRHAALFRGPSAQQRADRGRGARPQWWLRRSDEATGSSAPEERGAERVACVHADGQYGPEVLPALLRTLEAKQLDLLQGSRIAGGSALSGGMPPTSSSATRCSIASRI